jgi:hypothetical protein
MVRLAYAYTPSGRGRHLHLEQQDLPAGPSRPGAFRDPGVRPDLRHSFVSLLSDNGAHLTDLASQGVDRNGTTVTGKVYRHQICPVIEHGATAMDQIFGDSAA